MQRSTRKLAGLFVLFFLLTPFAFAVATPDDAPKDSLVATQSYDVTSQGNQESYSYDITYWPHDPSARSAVLEATENGALLQAIRTEAAQMDVFPTNLIFAVKNENGRRVGWGLCYDLTFERYLVFYRFKTAACYATPNEIEECVATFATLSPKERALVLTAIYAWRKAQTYSHFLRDLYSYSLRFPTPPRGVPFDGRQTLFRYSTTCQLKEPQLKEVDTTFLRLGPKGRRKVPYLFPAAFFGHEMVTYPYYGPRKLSEANEPIARTQFEYIRGKYSRCPNFIPPLVREYRLEQATEDRWNRLIESCVGSEEVAFEALDLDLEETKRAWEADCRARVAEVDELFAIDLPEWHVERYFKAHETDEEEAETRRYAKKLDLFLTMVERLEHIDPQAEKGLHAIALREFWFACQRASFGGTSRPYDADGLQSARPLTLGEIAKECLPPREPSNKTR